MSDRNTLSACPPPSRRQILGGALGGVLLAPALVGHAARAQAADPIRIGVVSPLTGQFAQNGQWMKNGTSLAAREINDRGGVKGRQLRLIFADDQGPNPTVAANAVTRLATQEKVVALVGPHYTPGILPNLPLLARFRVPCLSGSTGPLTTAQNNPWIFRVRLNDATGGALLVKYVTEDLGWKKVGLAYVNTAFGQGGLSVVKAALAQRGIEPALVQAHTDATKDYTSHILAFTQAGVDGIIVWTDDQPAGLLAKQCKTLGARFGIAGNTAFSQPLFLELAGDAAEGIMAVGEFVPNNPAPSVQEWRRRYAAAYEGGEPEIYASVYYDAVSLIAKALESAPEATGPALRDALAALPPTQSVVTTYRWTQTGDMTHSALITRVEGGKPAVVRVIGE